MTFGALGLVACQGPQATESGPAAPAPVVPAAPTVTVGHVAGVVKAPSAWLSAAYRLAAFTDAPVPHAEVSLVDGQGNPLPDVAPVTTDDQGAFDLAGVPQDRTYRVKVRLPLPSGGETSLVTLVSVKGDRTVADISLATTLAANLVVKNGGGSLGAVPAEDFQQATQSLLALLDSRPLPSSAEDPTLSQAVDAWVASTPSLKEALDRIEAAIAPTKPVPKPPTDQEPAANPGQTSSSGGHGRPEWKATLSLGAASYTGIASPLAITVTTTQGQATGAVTVTVASTAEPAGETVTLTAGAAGVFTGSLPFARAFDAAGQPVAPTADGKLTVAADAGVTADTVTVTFKDQVLSATYAEPLSTLTGVVRVAGSARAQAQVQLVDAQGVIRKTASRADGVYAFYDLPAGTYTLIVAVAGAQPKTSTVTIP